MIIFNVSATYDWIIFLLSDSLISDSHRCCCCVLGITIWTKIKLMCSFFSYKCSGTTQITKTVYDNRWYQLLRSSVFGKKVGGWICIVNRISWFLLYLNLWGNDCWKNEITGNYNTMWNCCAEYLMLGKELIHTTILR